MANKEVTLAAACMVAEHDKAKNLKKYVKFIEEAAAKGADFLAFSEVSLQGYPWTQNDDSEQRKYYEHEAEPVPGPATNLIEKQCKEHNMYIQYGFAEKAKDGLYNSAALIGPEGIVGVHRKVYGPGRKGSVFKRGNRFAVFDTKLGKFGMVICADLSFAPESVRTLVIQGAEVVVNSTCWGIPTCPMLPDTKTMLHYMDPSVTDPQTEYRAYQYDVLTRYSALVNQTWLICSDTVGQSSKMRRLGLKSGAHGHSRIITPIGKVLDEIGYEEGLAIATVDIKLGIDEAGYTDAIRNPKYKKFMPY